MLVNFLFSLDPSRGINYDSCLQEMMGVTYFLLNHSRKESEHCMENAFNTYLVCAPFPLSVNSCLLCESLALIVFPPNLIVHQVFSILDYVQGSDNCYINS